MNWKYLAKIVLVIILIILSMLVFRNIMLTPAPVPHRDLLTFQSDFRSDVIMASDSYDSFWIREYKFEDNCDEICITRNGDVISKYKNEKLFNFSLNEIRVDHDFCVKVIDHKFKLKLAYIGRGLTNISIPV